MFESLMRRDIAFFDDENNAVGNLTTQLADDARTVHKATGETFSNQLQACFTLLVGLVIGFTASWKITLVVLATFPINIAAGAMRMAERSGQHLETDDGKLLEQENRKLKAKNLKNKNSKANGSETELVPLGVEPNAPVNAVKGGEGGLISSAFINMRTVSAFSIQYEVSEQYGKMTEVASARRQGACFYSGFIFGVSQASMYFCYALLFWYGATLIVAGSISFVQLMTAMLALMLGALGLGQALNDLGDQTAGLLAAKRIFSAIDAGKASPIDGLSETGLKPNSRPKGRIELKNVFFSYPTRPEVEVCKDYSLVIEPGQVVALVGPSGSGKSTIMNLLLRFYDPVRGDVLLDGQDIRDLNVRWLRSQIGYVGQEPTLFSGSVSENISRGRAALSAPLPSLQEVMVLEKAGGCLSMFPKRETARSEDVSTDIESGHSKDGTPDDVLVASRLSYAHDFITSFTEGYRTDVGESSVMVSGGQKQRIAIARALIKQPSVLLLDEATSALDAASERIVQQSIDELQASKAQTTIVIAHR
jgi:ABC-type multidrug transport system fused ATPase/permease subunit